MARAKSSCLVLILLFLVSVASAQQDSAMVLSKDNLLSILRLYHPVMKQAELKVSRSRAELLQARGSFDPSVQADLDRKSFDGKLYYSYFNPQLTIPTWYGIDINAGIEEIVGERVSSEATLGQTSYVGVKVGANNLLFDKRRAALRQAQAMVRLSEAERALMVNDLLYDALSAYWNWVREYQIYKVLEQAVEINEARFRFVKTEYEQGNRPAIDTTEALTQLQQFQLMQANVWLAFRNAGLELSNYLWLEGTVPMVWNDRIVPPVSVLARPEDMPSLVSLLENARNEHPKLKSILSKIDFLEIERRLKAQYLLPKLSVKANLLSKGYEVPQDWSTTFLENNYKTGIDFSFPLFLREARGAYRSSKIKLRETSLEQDIQTLQIENKIKSYYNETVTLGQQIGLYENALSNYSKLLQGEKLRFEVGESTLFLLNSRENKVLEARQKLLELQAKWHKSYAGLLWAAGQLN